MHRDIDRPDRLVTTKLNSSRRVSGLARVILAGLLAGSVASRPPTTFAQEESQSPILDLSAECFEGAPRLSVRFKDGPPGRSIVLRFAGYYPLYDHQSQDYLRDDEGREVLEPTGEVVYPVYLSGLKLAQTEDEKNRASKFGLVPNDKPTEFTSDKSDSIIDTSGDFLHLSPEKTIKGAAYEVKAGVGVNLQTKLASVVDIENPLVEGAVELPLCEPSK